MRQSGDIEGTMKKLFTIDEVAEAIRVNPRTLRRWLKEGKISQPASKLADPQGERLWTEEEVKVLEQFADRRFGLDSTGRRVATRRLPPLGRKRKNATHVG